MYAIQMETSKRDIEQVSFDGQPEYLQFQGHVLYLVVDQVGVVH